MPLSRHAGIVAVASMAVVLLPLSQATRYNGPSFDLTNVADGVYVTQFKTRNGVVLTGNATVIVNDSDVVVVDSHNMQRDHAYLDLVVALLESTLSQTRQAVARRLDPEATRKVVNVDSLRALFTGGDTAEYPAFDGNFTIPAVERAWREARGELDIRK